uniref:Estradiol 17-beta-dehydrogenase 2 n=1 Tax=Anolis carolinensis TaxID=28377 RepID=A0A803TJD4_ANOCA
MVLYHSEADDSLLIYAGATLLSGGTILYRVKKSRVQAAIPFFCGILLLLALEILCFATLRNYLGLSLFSLVCLAFCVYTPTQAMLPVDRRAVLITGIAEGLAGACWKSTLVFSMFSERPSFSYASAKVFRVACGSSSECAQTTLSSAYWSSITDVVVTLVLARSLLSLNSSLMSSSAGGIPMPRLAAYGSSKAALSMFSGVMRQELSSWGIKVAVVHPSGFRTCKSLGNPEIWNKEEQNLFESLAPDVRRDYGDDYICSMKTLLMHMPSFSASDFSPVLHDVLHALLAMRPYGLYTPGKNAYKYLLIFCYSPLWFYDFFIGRCMSLPSMPSALRVAKN